MKTIHYVIIGAAVLGGIGPALLFFTEMTSNSQETLSSRFFQSFFNTFTLVPILVITLGSVIFLTAIRERNIPKQPTSQIILVGSVIIFLGFGIFSFYLID